MLRSEVERVVEYLYERYSEPITLADMAAVARLSPFHFSRIFLASTGASPCRFLSAVRLHMAKTLLLTTSQTVTDISYMVGYNSLGTFTTRFTRSVGVTPLQFRRVSGRVTTVPSALRAADPGPRQPAGWVGGERALRSAYTPAGSVVGRVSAPREARPDRVYLGVFDSAIAQGPLVACAVLDGAVAFELLRVPEGEWYVLAVSAGPGRLVANSGPVKVIGGERLEVRLALRAVGPADPPVLLALPDLETAVRPE